MIGVASKAKLLVFFVFLIGAVTGAVVEKVYDSRSVVDADTTPAKTAQKRAQEVQDYLDLNDEQRRQFDVIVEEFRPEFRRLNEENGKLIAPILAPNRKKAQELQEQMRTKVRTILTDEQKIKYAEFNENLRKRQLARSRQNQNPGQNQSPSQNPK